MTPEKRDQLARKGTIHEEAYDLFLRGREQAWLQTKSSNVEARDLLGCAITISPGFAAAYALIAYTHAVDYANGWGENPEWSLQTSLEIAGRAVQLNDEDPEAHVDFAVALAWHRELDRALAEARRSIALAPNFARGHLIVGRMLTMSGDAAAAINAIMPACGLILSIGISRSIIWLRREFPWGSSTRRSQPSSSGWSATPMHIPLWLCLHRATAISAGLPKLGQLGRR